MSDQESDVNPTSPGAESEAIAPYSSNGNDPGGLANNGENRPTDVGADGNAFLADLAKAMQSTAAAEQARNAEVTEQRRQTHVDAIRAREALEAEDLRELAKEDVKGIDAWSDGEIKRIKLERERRIATRREQLQVRLEDHRAVIGREVDAVEAAVSAYKTEIELYFMRLESEVDPVAIARYAGNRPVFPNLDRIGPADAPPISAYQPIASDAAEVAVIDTHDGPADDAVAAPDPGDGAAGDAVGEVAATSEAADAGDPGQTEDAQPADAPLVAVMDPESASTTPATPWSSASDANAEPAHEEAAAVGEGSVNEGSEVPEGEDGAEEPVAAVAEARVVMPRSSGAGSWLRWPNGSADRSDTGH
jgi:hypothetical protein